VALHAVLRDALLSSSAAAESRKSHFHEYLRELAPVSEPDTARGARKGAVEKMKNQVSYEREWLAAQRKCAADDA
jgi:hypothetical protein